MTQKGGEKTKKTADKVATSVSPTKTLAPDTCIEGKLETTKVSGDFCCCQISVKCPACGKPEIVAREVPASLKSQLARLLHKDILIVHAGGRWAATELKNRPGV